MSIRSHSAAPAAAAAQTVFAPPGVPASSSTVSDNASSGAWLQPLPGHWIEAARTYLSHQGQVVRVTVAALRGSAPREPGASMLVGPQGAVGTIGGGHLEWRACELARELLADPRAAPLRLLELILGPDLGQCCGGRVELWLERLTRADLLWLNDAARRLRTDEPIALATDFRAGAVSHRLLRSAPGAARLRLVREGDAFGLLETLHRRRPDLWIFGAGHVGQALVRLLAELALYKITWIDSRAELLPAAVPGPGGVWGPGGVLGEVSALVSDSPPLLAASAPRDTRFVVMTHDHALDYELCRVILERDDAFWLGLIGSASKAARFRSRLQRAGSSAARVARLNCPIGVPGISSKLPAAIAIAIAAQLLQQDAAPAMPLVAAGAPADPSRSALQACDAGNCSGCGSPRERS
jgi:xanthine dehydrogenase accessory factor